MQKIALLSLFYLIPQVLSFWTACPTGRPPIDVYTSLCPSSGCTAVRGELIDMRITLDFLEVHHNLRPRGTVFVFGIPVLIPDLIDDLCPHITLNGAQHGCPVVPNVQYQWTINMTVPNTIPPFNNGRIRVEVLDGNRILSCFDAHGNIV